uniref:Uncharacterized protein n=1 Tax=Meloidogyne incognita TaxID=6306 RepID=A0A914N976_MELIC
MNVNNRISAVRRSKKTMEQIIHTTRILIDNDVNTYYTNDITNNDISAFGRYSLTVNKHQQSSVYTRPFCVILITFSHVVTRYLAYLKDLGKYIPVHAS